MRIVRRLVGGVVACLFGAVAPASAQQVTYVGQTDASVAVSYSNLPAGTALLYLNKMTGAKGTALAPLGGSGTITLPMPPGPGSYSIIASDGDGWLAQTVEFYSKDTALAGGTTAPTGNWSVTVTNNGELTSFGGNVVDGTVAYATAPPPPTSPGQMRTYVSVSGSDSGGCAVVSPCKTLQAAIDLTLERGEVFVLDSGYYGPVTINKAMAITSEGVLAATGAIIIAADSGDDIALRGLDVNGGHVASTGIRFTSGRTLTITKSVVRQFTDIGINVTAGKVFIQDTIVSSNGNEGIALSGKSSGIVNRVSTVFNSGAGISVSGVPMTINESVASNNNYGIVVEDSETILRNSTSINNTIAGLQSDAATVQVSGSTIAGLQSVNDGKLLSFGNNNFSGGSPTATIPLL